MAQKLKTNTATRISLGPFLDATDAVTPETALTVANTAITVIAETDDNSDPTVVLDAVAGNDGTNTLAHLTGDDAGMYSYRLTAANLNRLGRITVIAVGAAHVPVFKDFEIVTADAFNSQFSATFAEATGVPAATATPWAKLNFLFLKARNKITQTSTTQTIFADDGSTTVATSTVSDNGTTATRGELA
jgi:hypothetical protein